MKRLRVLLDFEAFSDQDHGGISRYSLELALRLGRLANVQVYGGLHRSKMLRDYPANIVHGRYFPALRRTGELRRRINAWLMRKAIKRFQPEIVHRTYYRHCAKYPGSHVNIATIYDLTYFRYPEEFRGGDTLRGRMMQLGKRSDHLIAISECTRRDAIEYLKIHPDRISTIHLGVAPNTTSGTTHFPVPAAPYVLFVGKRGGYKNAQVLLQALSSASELSQVQLLFFGGGPLNSVEKKELSLLGLAGRTLWADGGDQRLGHAFANAAALVYPSRYEGFGLPLLEAMAAGCPVICSNSSSLPEVGGNAAEYFAPDSPAELALALRRVLYTPNRAEELRNLGWSRTAQFTWDECARKTMKLYQQVVQGRSTTAAP